MGCCKMRVRRHVKVFSHLMFGLFALTVNLLMRPPVIRDGNMDINSILKNAEDVASDDARPSFWCVRFCSSEWRRSAEKPCASGGRDQPVVAPGLRPCQSVALLEVFA